MCHKVLFFYIHCSMNGTHCCQLGTNMHLCDWHDAIHWHDVIHFKDQADVIFIDISYVQTWLNKHLNNGQWWSRYALFSGAQWRIYFLWGIKSCVYVRVRACAQLYNMTRIYCGNTDNSVQGVICSWENLLHKFMLRLGDYDNRVVNTSVNSAVKWYYKLRRQWIKF